MISYDKEAMLNATQSEGDQYAQMRKEFSELRTFINELEKIRNEKIIEWHKKKMQSLKQGATVWTTRNFSDMPYGTECRKVSNGSKRMQIVTGGTRWTIPYSDLSDTKPDELTITMNRTVAKILSNVQI